MGEQPSESQGFRGKGFIDTKSVKAALEFLQQVSEIPPEQWRSISETTRNVRAITEMGGADTIVQDFKTFVKDIIAENINAQLAPIYNEIDMLLNTAISQFFIDNNLDAFINSVSTWLSDNSTGVTVGALAGSVYGKLGELVGAIVGAIIQEALTTEPTLPENMDRHSRAYHDWYYSLPLGGRQGVPMPLYPIRGDWGETDVESIINRREQQGGLY